MPHSSCLLFFALFVAQVFCQYGLQISTQVNVTGDGSQKWWALLHLPDDYASTTTKYPLIMFMHGIGEVGSTEADLTKLVGHGLPKQINNGANMQFTVGGKLYKFIVISPQAPGGWVQ